MEHFDAIVIGGGPAGLMAAGRAAEMGERVLLVEKNHSLGEKLLLAGKRRFSMTNAEPDMELFLSRYGENGRFLRDAFGCFGPAETVAFFNRNGIKTKVERGSRVFPEEGHKKTGAERIFDCLLLYCKKGNVRILRKSPVKAMKTKNGRIERVITGIEELSADRYILATGGKSYPKTGSTGDGYRFAAQAGHTIVEPTPAIVAARAHNGLCSFDNAVVTKGGVSLKEVESTTLRSKFCDNLYFAGEILDLNGPAGGFNLQICWSTGYVAGQSVARVN